MKRPVRLLLFGCCCATKVTGTVLYKALCSLKNQETVQLAQDPTTGRFVKIKDDILQEMYTLENGDSSDGTVVSSETGSIESEPLRTDDWIKISAKECRCGIGNDYLQVYCPTKFTHCSINVFNDRSTGNATNQKQLYQPDCVVKTRGQSFARSVFPVILIWYCVMIVCLVCMPGHHVLDHVASLCISSWPQIVVGRVLRRQPDRARRLLRQAKDLVAMYIAAKATRKTTKAVRLRIMSYTPEQCEGEDDDEQTCTICFATFHCGDRVGALPCHHVFHASCLKTWLARRQKCPLCQREDIVERVYDAQLGSPKFDVANPNPGEEGRV